MEAIAAPQYNILFCGTYSNLYCAVYLANYFPFPNKSGHI